MMIVLRNVLVLFPAFLLLHLSAAGFLLLALENGPAFMDMFELSRLELVLLALAFPIGYATAIPKGLVLAANWTPRVVLAGAVFGSFIAGVIFAFWADDFWLMFLGLLFSGGSAGVALPMSIRLFGLAGDLARSGVMALLIGAAWFVSAWVVNLLPIGIVGAAFGELGIPLPPPPAWGNAFVLQMFFEIVWFLPVLFLLPRKPLDA